MPVRLKNCNHPRNLMQFNLDNSSRSRVVSVSVDQMGKKAKKKLMEAKRPNLQCDNDVNEQGKDFVRWCLRLSRLTTSPDIPFAIQDVGKEEHEPRMLWIESVYSILTFYFIGVERLTISIVPVLSSHPQSRSVSGLTITRRRFTSMRQSSSNLLSAEITMTSSTHQGMPTYPMSTRSPSDWH
jgi:hypothetical protein